jgi:hypothetical protein
MEDVSLVVLGCYMIYSAIHLAILQGKAWIMRSGYEKFVSVFAFVVIALLFLGAAMD